MKDRSEKKIYSYKENPEKYIEVLDTCVRYYEEKVHTSAQTTFFSANTILTFLMAFFTVYLTVNYKDIANQLLASITDILAITVIITVNGFILYLTEFFFRRYKLAERWTKVNVTKENLKVLNSLYLAKIEPERWDLVVTVSREEKRIRDVSVEPAGINKTFFERVIDRVVGSCWE